MYRSNLLLALCLCEKDIVVLHASSVFKEVVRACSVHLWCSPYTERHANSRCNQWLMFIRRVKKSPLMEELSYPIHGMFILDENWVGVLPQHGPRDRAWLLSRNELVALLYYRTRPYGVGLAVTSLIIDSYLTRPKIDERRKLSFATCPCTLMSWQQEVWSFPRWGHQGFKRHGFLRVVQMPLQDFLICDCNILISSLTLQAHSLTEKLNYSLYIVHDSLPCQN